MKRSKLSNFKIEISILQTGDKRGYFFLPNKYLNKIFVEEVLIQEKSKMMKEKKLLKTY
jgi:hypothetical protein